MSTSLSFLIHRAIAEGDLEVSITTGDGEVLVNRHHLAPEWADIYLERVEEAIKSHDLTLTFYPVDSESPQPLGSITVIAGGQAGSTTTYAHPAVKRAFDAFCAAIGGTY